MSLDARVEVRLVLERVQAHVMQFLYSELEPLIEARVRDAAASFDFDTEVKTQVFHGFREEVQRAIRAVAADHVRTKREEIEARVDRALSRLVEEA